MNKKLLIILLIIIVFLLGFFSRFLLIRLNVLKCEKNYCYKQCWTDVENILQKRTSNIEEKSLSNRKYLNGEISKVLADKIIVAVNDANILPKQNLALREIVFEDGVIIERLEEKEESLYSREVEEFKNKNKAEGGPDVLEIYPDKFYYKTIEINDLRAGENIFVQSNENIADNKIIKASLIRVID